MTNTQHSQTDFLCDNYASAGYCHFAGCENRERIWMSDEHVALADGFCAAHSNLARCGAPLNAKGAHDECAKHGPCCTTRVTRFRVDASVVQ